MRIKILKSCSGYRFSFRQGETVDVEKYIAEDLVNCGFAEKVQTAKAAAIKRDTKNKRDTKPKNDIKTDGEANADT